MTTTNELIELWEHDCEIDQTELANESLKIPKLQAKYKRFYIQEKAILLGLQASFEILYLKKHEFYTMGPTKESKELGWEMPAKGMIYKPEVPLYMNADPDISKLKMRIDIQKEKVDMLVDNLKNLVNRSFNIGNAIQWMKWTSGT